MPLIAHAYPPETESNADQKSSKHTERFSSPSIGQGVQRQRGVHLKRRPRRPLPGMLLHISGSHHQWFEDERWYDLIVILDGATSEILLRPVNRGRIDADGHGRVKEAIASQGVFCALYSDRGSHFWLTPKAGGKIDPHRLATSILVRSLPAPSRPLSKRSRPASSLTLAAG